MLTLEALVIFTNSNVIVTLLFVTLIMLFLSLCGTSAYCLSFLFSIKLHSLSIYNYIHFQMLGLYCCLPFMSSKKKKRTICTISSHYILSPNKSCPLLTSTDVILIEGLESVLSAEFLGLF